MGKWNSSYRHGLSINSVPSDRTHRRPMQSVMQGMMHTMRLHALITEPKLIDAQPKPNSKVDLKHKRDCNEWSCSRMKQG